MDAITVVERSGDRKLSATKNVSASYVAQHSCPGASSRDRFPCAFLGNGCYAEINKVGFTTHRLNAIADRRKQSIAGLRLALAHAEADGIRGLSGARKLRVHVVGDCASAPAARIVSRAMLEHEAKAGHPAWTYTHAWKTVPVRAWQGARVLASCHSVAEVTAARARGYATAITTTKHPTNKRYQYHGETVIPCPAQFTRADGSRVVTCEFCTLCQRPEWLRANRVSVAFEPDGGTAPKVLAVLQRI